MRPFLGGRRSVVAAVSGGSDSLALLLLLNDFRRIAPALAISVVTVDHGLRTESAAEAARVAAIAARLGLTHRTLSWDGAKPAAGLIAAAREARYCLLAQAASEACADMILTGHTADDQAETVRMRLARGGDGQGRGLAGMAPLTLFETRAWIARPLLGLRRAALRAHLRSLGVAWIEDPTNADPRFERARLRRSAPDAADHFLSLAHDAARDRAATAARAAALVRAHADRPAPGLLRLAPTFAAAPDRSAALLALRLLLASVGGRTHPVEEPRAAALLAALEKPGRHTLGGAVAERRRDAVFLRREMRGIADLAFAPAAVFDGRYGIHPTDGERSRSPDPEGRVVAWVTAEPPEIHGIPASLARAAMRAQPAFRRADGRLVPLAAAGLAAVPVVAPFARFLPGFDLPLAGVLHALVGAPPLPSPPFPAPCLEPS